MSCKNKQINMILIIWYHYHSIQEAEDVKIWVSMSLSGRIKPILLFQKVSQPSKINKKKQS